MPGCAHSARRNATRSEPWRAVNPMWKRASWNEQRRLIFLAAYACWLTTLSLRRRLTAAGVPSQARLPKRARSRTKTFIVRLDPWAISQDHAERMTDAELLALFRVAESDRVERKESIANADRIRQAICAHANDLPNHPNTRRISIRGPHLAVPDDVCPASSS
jgi:hypothetical protein